MTMATAVELREQRAQLWERMKVINDGAEAESRDLSAEERGHWDTANADINAFDARIERQEQLERRAAPAGTQRQTATLDLSNKASLRASPQYAEAFGRWISTPSQALASEDRSLMAAMYSPADTRAMGTNVASAGGFWVPDSFQRRVEEALMAMGGMRSAATVIRTASGEDIAYPTSNDTSNTGEIVGQNKAVSEQDATVGVVMLKAFMFSSKLVKCSYQFLQDSAIDAEGWLAGILATRIARIQNTEFTVGSGANEPTGLMLQTTQGVAAATGQTITCTWDDLISLEQSVDPAYRAGARYMFRDSALTVLRKLKDGEGRYLWQPGQPTAGVPNTINGYPYTINQDMAAMAASANSIAFGDLRKYIIRDVSGMQMLRLEERYAEYLQVGFLLFARADGVLVDAGTHPVKHYTNSAS
jgi:HK97 family phage major capsid protein